MKENVLTFGQPGTEKWFGGPGTAEFIRNTYQDRAVLLSNVRAAKTRLERLEKNHPFRKELDALNELVDKYGAGTIDAAVELACRRPELFI